MEAKHTPGEWKVRPFLTPEKDDDPMGGTRMLGTVLLFLAVMATIGFFVWGWWLASDRLVGLGS